MKILLIDADSTIPNLALMKLSAWHKAHGDSIDLIRLNIPYYPTKKKVEHTIDTSGYGRTFCSCIFPGSKDFVNGNDITFGGTGFSLEVKLPEEIESMEPDYSIYPGNDTSYGFITRGCIRNCYFCYVPKKEGMIRQVSTIDEIVKHKKVRFLDNNILALSSHMEILAELAQKKIKCMFREGLDVRLLTQENSQALSNIRHIGEYTFAFDNIASLPIIEEKIKLLAWAKPWQLRFFVYVNPDMPLSDTVQRITWLRDKKCLPYVMRDIKCWDSPFHEFYVDLASWCNQPGIFKKLTFAEFLPKRHKGKNAENRVKTSAKLWEENNGPLAPKGQL